MSKSGALAVVLWGLASREALAASPELTEARQFFWTCPQTQKTAVPAGDFVSVPFSIASGGAATLDVSQFQSLLDTAASKAPGVDFFPCAQTFITRVMDELFDSDDSPYGKSSKLAAEDIAKARKQLKDKFNDALRLYGKKIYPNHPLSPFEPASDSEPPMTPTTRETMSSWLKSQCNLQIRTPAAPLGASATAAERLYLDRSFLASLPVLTASMSESCKRRLKLQYAQLLSEATPEPGSCAADSEPCKTRLEAVRRAAAYLAKAGLSSARDAAEETAIASCKMPDASLQRSLYDLINGFNEVGNCDYPAVGAAPELIQNGGTSAGSTYYLDRLADVGGKPVLRATVNFVFQNEKGAPSSDAAAIEAKVKSCYARLASKLKGPNGESLVIALKSDPSDKKSVRPISVIDSGSLRADAGTWNKDIPCEVILHETMHVLGLVDEYREQSNQWVYYDQKKFVVGPGFSPDDAINDCRITAPDDSIMSHPCLAFLAAGLTPDKPDEPECSGTKTPRGSLLYPAQFRTLTQPGCKRDNRLYYSCSREAYKTSRGRYGLDRCSVGLPAECQKGRANWLK